MIDRDDASQESVPNSPLGGGPTEGNVPLRERARRRFGLSRRQWEYLVAGAIFVPYPLAIGVYLLFDVSETAFLLVMSAYSLFAMYGSYKL